MKVSTLKKNPSNPRQIKGDKLDKLKASIEQFPQMMELRPIVIDENNVVLGGNMRLAAIKALGMKEIPDAWVKRASELSHEEKQRFVISDNAGFGEWDWDELANSWSDLPLADWGLDVPDLETIEPLAGDADAEPQIDKAAELNKKWKVKTGDLWQIGEHRLLCGDSTKKEDVERLMQGEKAHMCFTSPPYNAGVSAQLRGNTSIGDNLYRDNYDDNRDQSEFAQFLSLFTLIALEHAEYVFVNIQVLAGNKRAWIEWMHGLTDKFADVAVWDKTHAAPAAAQRVMDSRFEFIFVFSNNATRAIGTRDFRGMVHNVYTGNPQRNNDFASSHAATMPVDLPVHFITTFTNTGERVYEPFTGTGTTLVACQNNRRVGYGVELSPDYCAVILERMATAFPDIEIKRIEDAKAVN